MKRYKRTILVSFCSLLFATLCCTEGHAQNYYRDYTITRGGVFYRGQPLREANPRYFRELGYGYGKDDRYVFLFGKVLEYVDPSSFRLVTEAPTIILDPAMGAADEDIDEATYNQFYGGGYSQGGYVRMENVVLYRGAKLEGASARSFQYVGKGYAKDDWNVYFEGKKIKGASSSNFSLVGGFYAMDSWNVYYRGRKVEGASTSNFHYRGGGYAEDTWNSYYQGRKI